MSKTENIEHKDVLGRTLKIGDHVAYVDSNSMRLGQIDKLNPKMVRIVPRKYRYTVNKYASDTVKLDGPDLVMYLLKD